MFCLQFNHSVLQVFCGSCLYRNVDLRYKKTAILPDGNYYKDVSGIISGFAVEPLARDEILQAGGNNNYDGGYQ